MRADCRFFYEKYYKAIATIQFILFDMLACDFLLRLIE